MKHNEFHPLASKMWWKFGKVSEFVGVFKIFLNPENFEIIYIPNEIVIHDRNINRNLLVF